MKSISEKGLLYNITFICRLRLLTPQYSSMIITRGLSFNFLSLIWIVMGGLLMLVSIIVKLHSFNII